MVRKQEILDAKVYIHDEMNRLMLVTTAMTETVTLKEEFESVLTLWRNNAVLLGNEAEKDIEDVDALEIEKLAKKLGAVDTPKDARRINKTTMPYDINNKI